MKRPTWIGLVSVLFVACISALLGCGSVGSGAGEGALDSNNSVTFFVGDADPDGSMLEGVNAWIVTNSGDIVLGGKTDVFGSVALSRRELEQARLVGFSAEGFFHGVFWIEELAGFRERYIRLARFAVL